MHTKYYKVALAMAAGISLGAAAVEGLHAQAKRAGYVVAEIDMNDQDGYMKEFFAAGGESHRRGGRQICCARRQDGIPSR